MNDFVILRSSTEPSNNIPPLDSVMLELLSYEEAELMTLIREAEKERSKLEEKLKKCDKDIQSQIEAIAEEEHKLENIVKQFSL